MATWTQKQIAALSGAQRDFYEELIAQGERPADALNMVRGMYGSAPAAAATAPTPPTTAAQFRAAEQATLANMQGKQPTVSEQEIIKTIGTNNVAGSSGGAGGGGGGAGGTSNLPSGFISGSLPSELAVIYGSDPDVVGYRITTNPDGSMSVSVVKSNGSVIGYGAKVRQNPDGSYSAVRGEELKNAEAKALGANSETENAIELLKRTFANYGLESLADTITDLVRKGYKSDTISLMLQDTDAYKKRFAANEARKKAGLAVLSPAEYLATEAAYRQVMSAAGLPKGFYDSTDDFTKFLANDMSPSELNQRVAAAEKSVANTDPMYQDQLRKLYGLSNGEMIAYALDPDKALPIIERRAKAVDYATAAAQQGVNVGLQPSEYYAGLGVTEAQARQGFSQIAQTMPTYEKLQNIYGSEGQDVLGNLQAAAFGGTGQAAAEQDILKKRRQEIGQFSGSAGAGQTAFGTSATSGLL